MPFHSGVYSSTKWSLDLKEGLCLSHSMEKRKALIKIQYHGYPQAMLQQERVERERFHESASQGVAHNQCDGNGGGGGGDFNTRWQCKHGPHLSLKSGLKNLILQLRRREIIWQHFFWENLRHLNVTKKKVVHHGFGFRALRVVLCPVSFRRLDENTGNIFIIYKLDLVQHHI